MSNIRSATMADAAALAELAEATFRDTFAAHNTAEDMTAHCQLNYGADIQSQEILRPDIVTLVAQIEHKLVAYAQLRWAEAPNCMTAEHAGEIQRLYVDKNYHGQGLAHQLMHACLDVFQQRQTTKVWLGVWEQNPRAISFYKKFNFQEVGEHIFVLGADRQRDIILALALNQLSSS